MSYSKPSLASLPWTYLATAFSHVVICCLVPTMIVCPVLYYSIALVDVSECLQMIQYLATSGLPTFPGVSTILPSSSSTRGILVGPTLHMLHSLFWSQAIDGLFALWWYNRSSRESKHKDIFFTWNTNMSSSILIFIILSRIINNKSSFLIHYANYLYKMT